MNLLSALKARTVTLPSSASANPGEDRSADGALHPLHVTTRVDISFRDLIVKEGDETRGNEEEWEDIGDSCDRGDKCC